MHICLDNIEIFEHKGRALKASSDISSGCSSFWIAVKGDSIFCKDYSSTLKVDVFASNGMPIGSGLFVGMFLCRFGLTLDLNYGSLTIKRKQNDKNNPRPPAIAKPYIGFISTVNLNSTPILKTSPITRPIPCIEAPIP